MTTPDADNNGTDDRTLIVRYKKVIARSAAFLGLLVVAVAIGATLVVTGTMRGSSATNATQSTIPSAVGEKEKVVSFHNTTPLLQPEPTNPSSTPTQISTVSTNQPTIFPSTVHSMVLSTMPSTIPSTKPSTIPSTKPSIIKSGNPSQSAEPSERPSLRISSTPSTTEPSISPSNTPTVTPSAIPTQDLIDSIGFYVMGDTPYAKWEQVLLEEQILNMTLFRKPNGVFTVHVGDLWKVNLTHCGVDTIDIVSATLLAGPLPTFVLAGDNDVKDCPDPNAAWGRFYEHFVPFEQNWINRSLDGVPTITALNVQRNYPDYSEMFAFVHLNVLFLSIDLWQHIPTDPVLLEEWNARMAANLVWATANIDAAYANDIVRAVVFFSHGQRSIDTRPFFDQIGPTFTSNVNRRLTPVLYIHGDGHKFELNTTYTKELSWTNFQEIQVDRGGIADPLFIEVAAMSRNTGETIPLQKEHDLQIVLADGLLRIDRQKGLYPAHI